MTKSMQTNLSRRRVVQAGAAGAALASSVGLSGCATTAGQASGEKKKLGRVVIVGAGFGGATAAKYLTMWGEGAIEVVLIDRQAEFYSCPISNLVLSGVKKLPELRQSYDGLRARGVSVVQDEVVSVDAGKKTITTRKGAVVGYDRLIVSPGIDFIPNAVQGLTPEAQKRVLHSWRAGPQTVALRAQLEAMRDGGVYVLTIPKAPYRCPPGPYERACQVANYFKQSKPKSKVLVLDANPDVVSKKGLFTKAWEQNYKGIITYTPNMNVAALDLKSGTLETDLGDKVKGDVLNVVPPHRAADIARSAGLVNVNDLWCGVDWRTMESKAVPGIHVLGDATFSAPGMPKSGHMANQHGKAAAAAIVELMNGRQPLPLTMANTCYSFTDASNVVHVASVHQWDDATQTMQPVKGAGGVSTAPSELEGNYALAWADNIWGDMFA